MSIRFSVSAALLSLAALPCLAEQVDLDLALAPANASQNTIGLTIDVLGGSASDTSTVSGNALANLDIDFLANGQVDMINAISFAGGNVAFDDNLDFDISFGIFGAVAIDGGGLAGQLGTPGPASPVNGAGDFDLAAHELNVNAGVLTAQGSGLASALNTTVDFGVEPVPAALVGTANLAITLDSVVGQTATYTATLTAPISFTEPFDANGVEVTVSADGNLVATDTFIRLLGIAGDVDGDGYVGATDLDLLLADWGTSGSPADADGSGTVDAGDLNLVISNWGQGTPPASVPEPGALALLVFAGLTLARRRRR